MSIEKTPGLRKEVLEAAPLAKDLKSVLLAVAMFVASCSGDTHKHFHTHIHGSETVDTGGDEGGDVDTGVDEDDDSGIDTDEEEEFAHDATTPWPEYSELGPDYGTPIQYADSTTFQFSGASLDEASGFVYFVGNEGRIARMDLDGRNVSIWSVGGDLEAIVVDESTGKIWVADENTNGFFVFDPVTGERTDESCVVDSPVNDRLGLEAAAIVDDEVMPWWWDVNGGQGALIAGSQADSMLRVYDLDQCDGGALTESVAFIETSGGDVSGLDFIEETACLLVVHDGTDTLDYVCLENLSDPGDEDGEIVRVDDFPMDGVHDDQEGVSVLWMDPPTESGASWQATILATYDDGGAYLFPGYPIAMP